MYQSYNELLYIWRYRLGTHLAKFIKSQYNDAKVWNLDVVNPEKIQEAIDNKVANWATLKDYKTALCKGERHQVT